MQNNKIQTKVTTINKKQSAPIKKFRVGGISVDIWENVSMNQKGEEQTFRNVSIQKSYKDKNSDEWKTSTSFNLNDIPKLQTCLTKAYEYLALKNETVEDD